MFCVFSGISVCSLPGIAENSREQLSNVGASLPKTLHEAAFKGDIQIVKSLLEAGVDPNAYDQAGISPLHWAVHGENQTGGKRVEEYIAIIEMLLLKGGNPNQRPNITLGMHTPLKLQNTILALAADGCSDRVVSVLLKSGADPNSPTLFTPLKYASWHGCPEIVRLLINSGAYVEHRSNGGESALDGIGRQVISGFYREHVDVVRQLLAAGANPIRREEELRAALGRTNNRFVGRRWAKEILALLQRAREDQWQRGSFKSSGKISERMN
jgi:ankyrin repeat protein